MKVKFSSFCGLARNSDWQNWLKEVSPILHKDLMKTVKSGRGCRANSRKMEEIYNKIYQDKLGPRFEDFIKRRFPYMIVEESKPIKKKPQIRSAPKGFSIANNTVEEENKKLNKHKVFKIYQPDLLTFPQKLILSGDPKTLYERVKGFVKDKLAIDYLIIEDRAYIEYFEARFASVIEKVPRTSREIYRYRQKMQQSGE